MSYRTPTGELEECVVVKKPDGRSRGFGFAKFVNPDDATAAIAVLDGYVMNAGTENERPLRLQFARELLESAPAPAAAASPAPARRKRERKPRPDPGTVSNQIYCSNLPADFRASHLKSMFVDYSKSCTPNLSYITASILHPQANTFTCFGAFKPLLDRPILVARKDPARVWLHCSWNGS